MNKDKIYRVLTLAILLMFFIVGLAAIIDAVYPVDSFVIDPTPEQARVLSFVLGIMIWLNLYSHRDHIKELIRSTLKKQDNSVKQ
jgi:hypothetical protein